MPMGNCKMSSSCDDCSSSSRMQNVCHAMANKKEGKNLQCLPMFMCERGAFFPPSLAYLLLSPSEAEYPRTSVREREPRAKSIIRVRYIREEICEKKRFVRARDQFCGGSDIAWKIVPETRKVVPTLFSSVIHLSFRCRDQETSDNTHFPPPFTPQAIKKRCRLYTLPGKRLLRKERFGGEIRRNPETGKTRASRFSESESVALHI